MADLVRTAAWALPVLGDPAGFQFGTPPRAAAVLAPREAHPGRTALRYRDDGELSARSPIHANALRALSRAIADRTVSCPLESGDAYVVDNHRMLHGRSAFSGHRVFLRYLLDTPKLALGIAGPLDP